MRLINFASVLLAAGLLLPPIGNTACAENSVSLPSKSEWLADKIRRGADGKLYSEKPEVGQAENKPEIPKPANQTLQKHTQETPSKTIYKDSAILSWSAPKKNIDGSLLKNLAGYKIYYWSQKDPQKKVIDVKNVTEYRVEKLSYGDTHSFAVTAYSSDNIESEFSRTVSVKTEAPVNSPKATR